jgi:anti-anti-sigma regulatory factor
VDGGAIITCDVSGAPAEVATVDALARLTLDARRRGCRIVLQGVSPELRALVGLVGLESILITPPRSTP